MSAATQGNQFMLLSVVFLGALIVSTVAFALSAFLIGYLLVRYQSAWVTYRSYAITTSAILAAVWLTLLVGAAVILPRENKSTMPGQFGATITLYFITMIGFLVAAVVCAIGLAQSQRTLTFATILALSGLAFLWVLIGGAVALSRSRKAFAQSILGEEREGIELSSLSMTRGRSVY
jgi:hypothetical protein